MEEQQRQRNPEPSDERLHDASGERERIAESARPNPSVHETAPGLEGDSSAGGRGARRQSKLAGELTEWIKALAIAGILVFVIRWFLISPFIVDGPSMQPNFWNHERILVNKLIYDFRAPKRGEVIVFHVPEEGRDFIKRVIGVPGDTVKVEGDKVFINGKQIDEPYLKEAYDKAHRAGGLYNQPSDTSDFPNSRFPDGKVPEGMLFVMGDNRSNSEDSRMIGFIPISHVVGRAELIFWPIQDIRLIKHG